MANDYKIRPIIIHPFSQPRELGGLEVLYDMVGKLSSDSKFAKPVTIVNNQTKYRCLDPDDKNKALTKAFNNSIEMIKGVSDITYVWAVDTCAMWLRGFGDTFELAQNDGGVHDVFWLIPGDFNYSTQEGIDAIAKIHDIPLKVYRNECEICLGEIEVPINSSKQLIDTYGTYGLLYNWFPAEAQGIRVETDKPRSEFFALSYPTLEKALVNSRWFAYEQTLMILLQNMKGKISVRKIGRVKLGKITDDESTRSTLASAMQQVERTERALKLFWREEAQREGKTNWHDEFRTLDAQSESIRTSAMVILRRLLA